MNMKKNHIYALRVAGVLWVVWGLVHMLAGGLTMGLDTAAAISGIADGVDPALLTNLEYHGAAGAVVKQHGWNLGWIGLTTIVCGVLLWRRNMTAVWLAALTGGMADVGYFLFLDLGGYVNFVPGTIMTFISGSATLLGGWVLFAQRSASA
jgi:hypothetical protein